MSSFLHFLAALFLSVAVIFCAWSLSHGAWNWHLLALLGLTAWCISGHPKIK
jgi:hypothetical protein